MLTNDFEMNSNRKQNTSSSEFSNYCETFFAVRETDQSCYVHILSAFALLYMRTLTYLPINRITPRDPVPVGSPSRGGDVTIYAGINQPNLPTLFYSVLVSIFVFMALSTVFHSINSPDSSQVSLCPSAVSYTHLTLPTRRTV